MIHGQVDTLIAVTMQYHIYNTFPKKQIGIANNLILSVQILTVTFLGEVISSLPLVKINETYKYSEYISQHCVFTLDLTDYSRKQYALLLYDSVCLHHNAYLQNV